MPKDDLLSGIIIEMLDKMLKMAENFGYDRSNLVFVLPPVLDTGLREYQGVPVRVVGHDLLPQDDTIIFVSREEAAKHGLLEENEDV